MVFSIRIHRNESDAGARSTARRVLGLSQKLRISENFFACQKKGQDPKIIHIVPGFRVDVSFERVNLQIYLRDSIERCEGVGEGELI